VSTITGILLLANLWTTAAEIPQQPEDASRQINIEALSRLKGIDLESNPALKTVVFKILDQVRGTAQFVEIVNDFNIKGQASALLEIAAKDPSGPTAAEAMRLVLRDGSPRSSISVLMKPMRSRSLKHSEIRGKR
jgi:hypothetical protein